MKLLIFSYLLGLVLAEISVIEITSNSTTEAPLENDILQEYPWLNSHPFSISPQFFSNFGKLGPKHEYLGFTLQGPILELGDSKSCGCQAQKPSTKPLSNSYELDPDIEEENLYKTPDKPNSSFYTPIDRPSNSTKGSRSQPANNIQKSASPSYISNSSPSTTTYVYDLTSRPTSNSSPNFNSPSSINYPVESFTPLPSSKSYQLPSYGSSSSFNPQATHASVYNIPYHDIFTKKKNYNEQESHSLSSSLDQTVSENESFSYNYNNDRSTGSSNNPQYSLDRSFSDDPFYSDIVFTPFSPKTTRSTINSNVPYYIPPPKGNEPDLFNQQSILSQPLFYDSNSNALSSLEDVSNKPYYNTPSTNNNKRESSIQSTSYDSNFPMISPDNIYSSSEPANAWSPNIPFHNIWPPAISDEHDVFNQQASLGQRSSHGPNTSAQYSSFSNPTTSLSSRTQNMPSYKSQVSSNNAELDQTTYDPNSNAIFPAPEFSNISADQTRPYRSATSNFQQSTNPLNTHFNKPQSVTYDHNSNKIPSGTNKNPVYSRPSTENVQEFHTPAYSSSKQSPSYENSPFLTNKAQEFNNLSLFPSYNPQSQLFDTTEAIYQFHNPIESISTPSFGLTSNNNVQDTFNPSASSGYNKYDPGSNQFLLNSQSARPSSTSRPHSTIPVPNQSTFTEMNNSPNSDQSSLSSNSQFYRPSLNDNGSFNFPSSSPTPESRSYNSRDVSSRFHSNTPPPYGTPTNQDDQDYNSPAPLDFSSSGYHFSYDPREFSSRSESPLNTLPPNQSPLRNRVQELSYSPSENMLPHSKPQSKDALRTADRSTPYSEPANFNIQKNNSPTQTSSYLYEPSYVTSNPNKISSSENSYNGFSDATSSFPLPRGTPSPYNPQQISYPQFTSTDFNNSNFQFHPESDFYEDRSFQYS